MEASGVGSRVVGYLARHLGRRLPLLLVGRGGRGRLRRRLVSFRLGSGGISSGSLIVGELFGERCLLLLRLCARGGGLGLRLLFGGALFRLPGCVVWDVCGREGEEPRGESRGGRKKARNCTSRCSFA